METITPPITPHEYDLRMKEINDKFLVETKPLREEMQAINRENSLVKKQMAALKIRHIELSARFHELGDQIHDIKQHYNEQKAEVYIQRPRACNENDNENEK